MDPQRYRAVKRVFEAAVDLPEASRPAYLERECGPDAGLRREVEELLDAHAGADDELDPLLAEPAPAGASIPLPTRPAMPRRIGDYRILGIAGRGGMGTVYEAEQDTPRRRVALKVIDAGVPSPQTLRRFELEAEVLGRLHHPGIAQIYEAGTFDDGAGPKPFFAMEFVRGQPITEYADQRGLDTPARLDLLVAVARAVNHAHQQGVIHRDLKPANILVDRDGAPKILDFGVARATDVDLQTATLQTQVGQLVGTVPYMSPEQASGDPLLTDVRTDVYSLGVLAFELLAGRLPIALEGRPLQDALRLLQEEEPSRLGTLDRGLRGDVETIVAKALEKEKDRRYASAGELAADVERYLNSEPIVARPASAIYQLRKFARRNSALVGGVGAGILIAFAALTWALLYSLELTADARAAEEVARKQANRASIAAAAAAIELGERAGARRQLETVPADDRAFEWHYYHSLLDTSALAFDVDQTLVDLRIDPEPLAIVTLEVDGMVRRWSAADGSALAAVRLAAPTPLTPSTSIWSSDRSRLDPTCDVVASIDRSFVRVHDAHTGAELAATELEGQLAELDFAPLGERIAIVGAQGLWTWEWREGRPERLDDVEYDRVDFSEDGLVGAYWQSGSRGAVEIFDPATGERLETHHEYGQMGALEVLPGGNRALVADFWKPIRGLGEPPLTLEGHNVRARSLAWSVAIQRLVSGGDDCVLRLWDLDRPSAIAELHGHSDPITRVAVDPDGRLVVGATERGVRLWDLEAPEATKPLRHPTYVYGVAFDPRDRLVTIDFDGTVRRWSSAGTLELEAVARRRPSDLVGADEITLFATSAWDTVALLGSGLTTIEHRDLDSDITAVDLSGPGHAVAVRTADRALVLGVPGLDIELDVSVDSRAAPEGFRHEAIALLDGGARVAFHDVDAVVVHTVDGRTPPIRLEGQSGAITALCPSPDGSLLACGSSDGSIWIWDLERRVPIATVEAHADLIYALEFSPDGERLASAGNDTTVRLWDPLDGVQVALFTEHGDYVHDVTFSRDGRRLASASGDATVIVRDCRPARER